MGRFERRLRLRGCHFLIQLLRRSTIGKDPLIMHRPCLLSGDFRNTLPSNWFIHQPKMQLPHPSCNAENTSNGCYARVVSPKFASEIVHDSAFDEWCRQRQDTAPLLPSVTLDYLKSLLICRRVSWLIVWWYFICSLSSPNPFRFSDVLWPHSFRCTKVTLLCKLRSFNVTRFGGIFEEHHALIANTMFAGIGQPVDCNGALWTVIS